MEIQRWFDRGTGPIPQTLPMCVRTCVRDCHCAYERAFLPARVCTRACEYVSVRAYACACLLVSISI